MEIKIKDRVVSFRYKLKKGENYRITKGKKFNSISFFKKTQVIKGMSSYCEDGKHVLFIDYDDVPLWIVKQDYQRLQEQFNLPQAYLFSTKLDGEFGNFHIVCLAKFNPKEVYNMLSITHADTNFMSMPLRSRYRSWVLRVGSKRKKERPKFVSFIGENINPNEIVSNAHLTLFRKLYPEIKHPKWNTDGLKNVALQEYEAS